MTDKRDETCDECRFFKENARESWSIQSKAGNCENYVTNMTHECRKHAITKDGFPTTEPDCWCGEFEWRRYE